jgi:hypothetical protein
MRAVNRRTWLTVTRGPVLLATFTGKSERFGNGPTKDYEEHATSHRFEPRSLKRNPPIFRLARKYGSMRSICNQRAGRLCQTQSIKCNHLLGELWLTHQRSNAMQKRGA